MSALNQLPSYKTKKPARAVGRGASTGKGKTSGRGHKGYKARSGSGLRLGFEGGQMALIARIPKVKGFEVINDKSFVPLNLDRAEKLAQSGKLTIEALIAAGFMKKDERLKVLGNGEIRSAITIEAHAFSKSALEKIDKIGGTANVIVHPQYEKKKKVKKVK